MRGLVWLGEKSRAKNCQWLNLKILDISFKFVYGIVNKSFESISIKRKTGYVLLLR